MKNKEIKKYVFVILVFLVVIACGKSIIGTRPFKDMNAKEIKSAEVYLIPPGTTVVLSDEDVENMVSILQNVRIYHRSWRHLVSGGQSCIFTITFQNNRVMEINACNPSMLINGKGYRVKYEECEALNKLANRLGNTRWVQE